MKNKIQIISLLTVLSCGALAGQQDGVHSEFPVLMRETPCPTLSMPANYQAPVYFSSSCKTAFILPSLSIPILQIDVTEMAGSSSEFCESWELDKMNYRQLTKDMNDLDERLHKNPSDPQNAEIQKTLEFFQKQKKMALSQWKNLSAVRVKVTLETDQDSQINAFQALNAKLPEIQFQPMPQYSSVLALGQDRVQTPGIGDACSNEGLCLGGVFGVDFPDANVTKIDGGMTASDQYHINMIGSAQGTFDINTPTYCEQIKKGPVDAKTWLKIFPMKLLTQYPVVAGKKFSLKASYNLKALFDGFSSTKKTQFTREEFFDKMLDGNVGLKINVMIDNGPIPNQTLSLSDELARGNDSQHPTLTNSVGTLFNKMISDFVNSLTGAMTLAGVISSSDNPIDRPPVEVSDGNTTDQVGSHSVCSSNGGFLGLFPSSSCHTEGIYITVHHDGLSEKRVSLNSQFNGVISAEIESNQTSELTSTSTFILKN